MTLPMNTSDRPGAEPKAWLVEAMRHENTPARKLVFHNQGGAAAHAEVKAWRGVPGVYKVTRTPLYVSPQPSPPIQGAVERVRRFLNARDFMGVGDFIDDQVTGASDHDPVVDLVASDLRALLARVAVLEGALREIVDTVQITRIKHIARLALQKPLYAALPSPQPSVAQDAISHFEIVCEYLLGEGPLRGQQFGDVPPTMRSGHLSRYWWRSDLRQARDEILALLTPAATDGAIGAVADFLKLRDESVLPDEADDAERAESAAFILAIVTGEAR